ncbi:MAG: sugar transferase [Gemmatimonas sp.]|jgi:lipopolysaccharide/colanic/teichoic acid biosynthesis glycosyltransferase|uniref:sugar transferase n=2 Tax=Gemmatimonas sp. TaxID=1962908 RepID=UPI0031BD6541|nr:sugar transferase [Gemmatimonas sp.]MCA2996239.1 sugar transferase [Gemmatimonas sp.]
MRDPRVSTIPVSGAGRTVSRASGSPELAGEPAAAEAMSETGPGDDFEPRRRSELASRVFNVVVALLMLTASLPVMLITALLIRLSSRGPVFYTQVRVGLDRRWHRTRALNERRREDLGGTPFTIYKFRSMRVDAEVNGQAVWAKQNDDRVTVIGGIIRKSRIDELPQLFNVLRGDMNIVGPRPERPSIFVRLREQIADYPVRQRVKPGITGLAQVSNPYDTDLDDVRRKVAFDIQYMQRQSIVEDVRIMLRTVPVMIFRIGGR